MEWGNYLKFLKVKLLLTIAFSSILILVIFQNCSKAPLEKIPYADFFKYHKIKINLCLENEFSGYTLDAIIPTSVGLKYDRNVLKPDSDLDGLTDEEEELYGFDKFNRRTSGGILDSICFQFTNSNNCTNLNLTCNHSPLGFGLDDCDAELAGISFTGNSDSAGLDSDRDGLIDYLEIIRGTNPLVADRFGDKDNDQRTNIDELLEGGNLNFYDKEVNELINPHFSAKKIENSNCTGETWEAQVQKLPWYPSPVDIIDSVGTAEFSIQKDQSLALITIKLDSLNPMSKSKLLVKTIHLNQLEQESDLMIKDFTLIGEIPK